MSGIGYLFLEYLMPVSQSVCQRFNLGNIKGEERYLKNFFNAPFRGLDIAILSLIINEIRDKQITIWRNGLPPFERQCLTPRLFRIGGWACYEITYKASLQIYSLTFTHAAFLSAVRRVARVREETRHAMRSVPMALKRLILLAFVILVVLPGNPPLPSSETIISKRLEKRKGVNKRNSGINGVVPHGRNTDLALRQKHQGSAGQ